MDDFRSYKVSAKAIADGIGLGLTGNVEKEIAHMARFSGNLTYPGANRRFHYYALNIQNGTVVAVLPFDSQVNEKARAEDVVRKRSRRDAGSKTGGES